MQLLWMADYWVELAGNWKPTRAIDQALAAAGGGKILDAGEG
ncbi:hypothetical protein [Streptomyces sp. NPDC086989]